MWRVAILGSKTGIFSTFPQQKLVSQTKEMSRQLSGRDHRTETEPELQRQVSRFGIFRLGRKRGSGSGEGIGHSPTTHPVLLGTGIRGRERSQSDSDSGHLRLEFRLDGRPEPDLGAVGEAEGGAEFGQHRERQRRAPAEKSFP